MVQADCNVFTTSDLVRFFTLRHLFFYISHVCVLCAPAVVVYDKNGSPYALHGQHVD